MDIKKVTTALVSRIREYVQPAIDSITDEIDGLRESIKAIESRQPEKGDKGDPGIMGPQGAKGDPGERGPQGEAGLDAYQICQRIGFGGDVYEWAESLRGKQGEPGPRGEKGESGDAGAIGPEGPAGPRGEKGEKGDAGPEGPAGPQGPEGLPGKSVDIDQVRGFVAEVANNFLESMRASVIRDLKAEFVEILRQMVSEIPPAKDGEPGPRGEKGEAGKDGASVTLEDVMPIVREYVEQIPKPRDGTDGKSVTPEDLAPMVESLYSKWALEWERRANDAMTVLVDKIPRPKDGKDGSDGKDGLGFDDFEFAQLDERNAVVRFASGERVKEFPVRIHGLFYRGVYSAESKYLKGDCATYGGSLWIAEEDKPKKPGDPGSGWKLAAKRGGK